MPGPLSITRTSVLSGVAATRTLIRPASGVNLAALPIRLDKIWMMRARSPMTHGSSAL